MVPEAKGQPGTGHAYGLYLQGWPRASVCASGWCLGLWEKIQEPQFTDMSSAHFILLSQVGGYLLLLCCAAKG